MTVEGIDSGGHLLRRTGIFGACPLRDGPVLCCARGSRGGVSGRGWLLRAAAAACDRCAGGACCLDMTSAMALS